MCTKLHGNTLLWASRLQIHLLQRKIGTKSKTKNFDLPYYTEPPKKISVNIEYKVLSFTLMPNELCSGFEIFDLKVLIIKVERTELTLR